MVVNCSLVFGTVFEQNDFAQAADGLVFLA